MTTPITQTKAAQLIEELNGMVAAGINDEHLVEIKSEAERLKGFGLLNDAYNVLGMVSSLQMNVEEVDRYFNAAIRSSGRETNTLINYAVALNNAFQSRRAVEIIDEVLHVVRDDIDLIDKAINIHKASFDFVGAQALLDRLDKLGGEQAHTVSLDDLKTSSELISAAGASWQSVSDRVSVAANAVSAIVARPGTETFIHDGVIIRKFVVKADDDEVFKAESAMIDALANQKYNPADRVIYFSCGAA